MEVKISMSYLVALFTMIFATMALIVWFPNPWFYPAATALFTLGYILHEPAHAIVAKMCGSKEIYVNLGGFSKNYVDFLDFEEDDRDRPEKLKKIYGAGAVIQVIQCVGIVIMAIISEYQDLIVIPSIIAISFVVLLIIDTRIPESDISRYIRGGFVRVQGEP